jgi:nitronate monooxygenase
MIAPQDRRLIDRLGLRLPIIQAPMAGATTVEMVAAVIRAGGLGSLPGASYAPPALAAAIDAVRTAGPGPLNVNVFCHAPPADDPAREDAWRRRLAPYFAEAGLGDAAPAAGARRAPFDEEVCAVVENRRPEVVSFHFGLPDEALLARVRRAGAMVLASATTVEEARWLDRRGVDAIIAQGAEAGGHRGSFLTTDMAGQVGLFALLPQVVDAVKAPVIAAGAIAEPRGVAAVFAFGAAAAQVGTAYLYTPEARIPAAHRQALESPAAADTVITNVFTGRPARGIVNRLVREIGPISPDAPAFPTAAGALAPLRAWAEAAGCADFTTLWAGQGAMLSQALPRLSSHDLTLRLAGA